MGDGEERGSWEGMEKGGEGDVLMNDLRICAALSLSFCRVGEVKSPILAGG